jgi:hypothetical protein
MSMQHDVEHFSHLRAAAKRQAVDLLDTLKG